MQAVRKTVRVASISARDCVACGTCVKVCPKAAIQIVHGIYAQVDETTCIGCGKCAHVCPASIINMEVRV